VTGWSNARKVIVWTVVPPPEAGIENLRRRIRLSPSIQTSYGVRPSRTPVARSIAATWRP
jgi:hypothetical protein